MSRIVRIAAGQAPVHSRMPDPLPRNIITEQKQFRCSIIEQLSTQAAEQKADIVCFAEHSTTQGVRAEPDDRETWEDLLAGPTAEWAGKLAKRLGIYLVLPAKGYIDGVLRNAAIVYDRGGAIIGHYEKVHCTRGEIGQGIVPGERWPVFKADFGTFGVLICHDISFPKAARCLTLGGAEIIFWPTHWGGWGEHHDTIVICSRAIDNGAWIVKVSLA